MSSIERRLARFIANERIVVPLIWKRFLAQVLAPFHGQQLHFVLDNTPFRDELTIVYLGLLVHSRVLPVAWAVMPAQTKWDEGQWQIVGRLLEQVRVHLPDSSCTLIADRGLAGMPLVKLCTACGWHYLLRICAEHTCRRFFNGKLEHSWKRLSTIVLKRGYHWYGRARVWQEETLETYVSLVWDHEYEEPWLLISDQGAGHRQVQTYAWRMRVEATFQDSKSRGWNIEASWIEDRAHARLACCWCSFWLCGGSGSSGIWPQPVSITDNGSADDSRGSTRQEHFSAGTTLALGYSASRPQSRLLEALFTVSENEHGLALCLTLLTRRKSVWERGRRARREQRCSDWEKAWDQIDATAFPICGRWQSSQPGRGTASRPSTACARQRGWQQTSACQRNTGRSRQRWRCCLRQRAILRKRAPPGLRPPGSSRNWRRVSRMRRCVRAFWLGHRFAKWCSTLNPRPGRPRKTTHSNTYCCTPSHRSLCCAREKALFLSYEPQDRECPCVLVPQYAQA